MANSFCRTSVEKQEQNFLPFIVCVCVYDNDLWSLNLRLKVKERGHLCIAFGVVREAPLEKFSSLFGHCPNCDCTPTLHSKALWGTLFPDRFELGQITVLTKVTQCILASLSTLLNKIKYPFELQPPNHPGRGSVSFTRLFYPHVLVHCVKSFRA